VVTGVATWRVSVADTCIASGSCLGIAPARFALGDDGLSHPTPAEIEADPDVLDAVASCPMEAIAVFDASTGERIEP
jgi:ferredoxin